MALSSIAAATYSSFTATSSLLAQMEEQSLEMRDHLKDNDIKKAMSSASLMLMALREDLPLSSYLALFQKATTELSFFYLAVQKINEKHEREKKKDPLHSDSSRSSSFVAELYEYAQGIGHVIPRAYLLVTIGSLLMLEGPFQRKEESTVSTCRSSSKTSEAASSGQTAAAERDAPSGAAVPRSPMTTTDSSTKNHRVAMEDVIWAHSIFKEILFACRGVAHPVRGLLLRHLVLSATRCALPGEVKSENEGGSSLKRQMEKSSSPQRTISSTGRTSAAIIATAAGSSDGRSNNDSTAIRRSGSTCRLSESEFLDAVNKSAWLLLENFEEVLNLLKRLLSSHETRKRSPFSLRAATMEGSGKEEKMFINPLLKRLSGIMQVISVEDYKIRILPRLLRAVACYPTSSIQGYILSFFLDHFPSVLHFHTMATWVRFLLCELPSRVDKNHLWRCLVEVANTSFDQTNLCSALKKEEAGHEGNHPTVVGLGTGFNTGFLRKPAEELAEPFSGEVVFEEKESSERIVERVPSSVPTGTGVSLGGRSEGAILHQPKGKSEDVTTATAHSLFDVILNEIDAILLVDAMRPSDVSFNRDRLGHTACNRDQRTKQLIITDGNDEKGDGEREGERRTALSLSGVQPLTSGTSITEGKQRNANEGQKESFVAQESSSTTGKRLAFHTLFGVGNFLVMLSSRIAESDDPSAYQGMYHFFEILHRYLLATEEVEKVGKDGQAKAFLWKVALHMSDVESFFQLKGIGILLDVMPHTFRHRLALLLCNKAGSNVESTRKGKDGNCSISVSNGVIRNTYLPLTRIKSDDTPLFSSRAIPSNRNPNSSGSVNSMSNSTSHNFSLGDSDEYDENGKVGFDIRVVGRTSSFPFRTVEGLRTALDFILDAFLLSGKMVVGDEEHSRAASVKSAVKDEKEALCKVISGVRHENRQVLFDMTMEVAQQLMKSVSYSQGAQVIHALCLKLLEVVSPSREFFVSVKPDKGLTQAIIAAISVGTTHTGKKGASDISLPSSISFIVELPHLNNNTAEVEGGNELRKPEKSHEVMGELLMASPSESTVPTAVSTRAQSESDSSHTACVVPSSLCTETIRQAFKELYSGGEGKGLLERLALLDAPAGCARFIDAAVFADMLQLGELVDAFMTEAFQLQENCGGEHASVELLNSFIQVLCTPLSSLSREQYERLVQGLSRQCSLLLRKDQQSRFLTLCAALHYLPFIASEEMAIKGKMYFERSQKLAQLMAPTVRFPLLLDLLEMSLQFFSVSPPIITSGSIIDQINEIKKLKNSDGVVDGVSISTPPHHHLDPNKSQNGVGKHSSPRRSDNEIKDPHEKRFAALLSSVKDLSSTNSHFKEIVASFSP